MTRALLPTATPRRTWRAIVEHTGRRRGHALLAVLMLTAGSIAGLAVPALLGRIVDVAVDRGQTGEVDRLALGLVAATVSQAVLAAFGLILAASVGERILTTLREQVMERALAVPLDELERYGTGDVVARVNGDVDAVSEATREAIPELTEAALTVGLTIVGLALIDPRLALAGLLAAPIQATAARWYLRRSGPIYADERIAEGARSEQLHASIAGAATVRAYRLGDHHLRRVEERSTQALALALATGRLRALFYSRINAAELTGLAAVLVMGWWLVDRGDVTVGAATAAALYFHRLFDPVGTLLMLLDTAQEAGAALARLVGVADLPAPPPEPPARPLGDPAVAVRGLHARYGDRDVLHGIDLDVPAGGRIAIVGPSGAGKTTLGKLVAGVHPVAGGELRLGDHALSDLGAAELRRAVLLVTQDVHVFAGPLRDDLRLANPEADDAALLAALETVGARAWAQALPEELDTIVGDGGGTTLTPTQQQQLALARLVLAAPPIVVLDEATAEAGSAGARILERSAEAALHGRTAIVIAHRLTQAAEADAIVVLEHGRVVEQGTHDELVAADGAYGRLWAAWSAARAD